MATPTDKQSSLNDLLPKGVVMLHLDARRPGVRVPDTLKGQEWLRLNFNHIKGKGDLAVNDWGVRETLRFNGQWFPVSVPWSAVFAMSLPDAQEPATIFAEDLPEEMVEAALARLQREGYSLEQLEENRPVPLWQGTKNRPEAAAQARPKTPLQSAPAVPPERPMTPVAPAPASSGPEGLPPVEPTAPKRGHLRLVK